MRRPVALGSPGDLEHDVVAVGYTVTQRNSQHPLRGALPAGQQSARQAWLRLAPDSLGIEIGCRRRIAVPAGRARGSSRGGRGAPAHRGRPEDRDCCSVKHEHVRRAAAFRANRMTRANVSKVIRHERMSGRAGDRLRDDRRATQPRSSDDLERPSNWAGVAITARTQGSAYATQSRAVRDVPKGRQERPVVDPC
jgi:hypothetical protein